jgi:hypothetical protein
MAYKRRAVSFETKQQVLHEAGYRCSNPACRTILTLDVHHLDRIADDGTNEACNLLALCPNCHSLHHKGHIPTTSVRAWKMLLLSLNEGLDRRALDVLLTLAKVDNLMVCGEGVLECASLIAGNLVRVDIETKGGLFSKGEYGHKYWIELTEKGLAVVAAWIRGDQNGVVNAVAEPSGSTVEKDARKTSSGRSPRTLAHSKRHLGSGGDTANSSLDGEH